MARPEKLFDITLTIYAVPQSKVNDWLTDFAAMDNDSKVTMEEVVIPFEEDITKETPE